MFLFLMSCKRHVKLKKIEHKEILESFMLTPTFESIKVFDVYSVFNPTSIRTMGWVIDMLRFFTNYNTEGFSLLSQLGQVLYNINQEVKIKKYNGYQRNVTFALNKINQTIENQIFLKVDLNTNVYSDNKPEIFIHSKRYINLTFKDDKQKSNIIKTMLDSYTQSLKSEQDPVFKTIKPFVRYIIKIIQKQNIPMFNQPDMKTYGFSVEFMYTPDSCLIFINISMRVMYDRKENNTEYYRVITKIKRNKIQYKLIDMSDIPDSTLQNKTLIKSESKKNNTKLIKSILNLYQHNTSKIRLTGKFMIR